MKDYADHILNKGRKPDGKKKKKRLDASLMPFYLPGSIPTHIEPDIIDKISFPPGWSLDNVTTQPGGQLIAGGFMAFYDYTFGGPIELMAGKSIVQGAVLSSLVGTGVYGSLHGAIAFELAMDFLIFGAVLTVIDPSNKWGGGVDELTRGYGEKFGDDLMSSGMWKQFKLGSVV